MVPGMFTYRRRADRFNKKHNQLLELVRIVLEHRHTEHGGRSNFL
jgi:hypothetical protein